MHRLVFVAGFDISGSASQHEPLAPAPHRPAQPLDIETPAASAASPVTLSVARSRYRCSSSMGADRTEFAADLPARHRDEHRHLLPITTVLIAEQSDQVAFLEGDADQNITRGPDGERGHGGCRPKGEQKAKIDRMQATSGHAAERRPGAAEQLERIDREGDADWSKTRSRTRRLPVTVHTGSVWSLIIRSSVRL